MLERHLEIWKVLAHQAPTYIESMTNRYMNLMRSVSQGLAKKNQARWVKELPWMASAAPALEGSACASAGDEKAWVVEYDPYLRTAVRFLKETPKEREPAAGLQTKPYCQEIDPVEAFWADGFRVDLPDVLARDLAARVRPHGDRAAEVIWEGEHHLSHHKLSVRRRNDRALLVSLFEQGGQVCQVRVDRFGDESAESLAKAGALMTRVAQAYACGDIEKDELLARRDQEAVKVGIAPVKRLAAASSKAEKPCMPDSPQKRRRKAGTTPSATAVPLVQKRPARKGATSRTMAGCSATGDDEGPEEDEEEKEEDEVLQEDFPEVPYSIVDFAFASQASQ